MSIEYSKQAQKFLERQNISVRQRIIVIYIDRIFTKGVKIHE